MKRLCEILLALPRSLYFNFRYLPLNKAIKFPVWLAPNVRIRNMYRGGISLNADITKPFQIKIGFHKTDAIDMYALHSIINIEKGGTWQIANDAHIGHGAILTIKNGAQLITGKNFAISGTTSIVCNRLISFGNDVQLSWDSLIMDSDAHIILDKNNFQSNVSLPIEIGDKNWIAAGCKIMKGTKIANNCVVAANSLLNKDYSDYPNHIIAGSPAKPIKQIGGWHI